MKTKNELLAELLITCVELNDKNFSVFFDYHGHVDTIDIRVHTQGWSERSSYDRNIVIHTCDRFKGEDCQYAIDKIKQLKIDATAEREELEKNEALRKEKRKAELLAELESLK